MLVHSLKGEEIIGNNNKRELKVNELEKSSITVRIKSLLLVSAHEFEVKPLSMAVCCSRATVKIG